MKKTIIAFLAMCLLVVGVMWMNAPPKTPRPDIHSLGAELIPEADGDVQTARTRYERMINAIGRLCGPFGFPGKIIFPGN